MKIRQINLTNFKLFTSTKIGDIPDTAKLIVLVGPNGCGKSSLIDAVLFFHRQTLAGFGGYDETYHRKQIPDATQGAGELVQVDFHDPQPNSQAEMRKAVYVRSAYRNDPEFQIQNLPRIEPAVNQSRVTRLIDNDQVVMQNYQRLVSQGFQEIFEGLNPNVTVGEFREQSIGPIRDAMQRLFPGLVLNSLGNPLSEGTFKFNKGDSNAFLYKNLSGGEKAAFDLLLDVLVKRREFDDTVFFIDEPEAHMSATLQGPLLQEVYDAIPDRAQLWIATHSIGMMRKARDISQIDADAVVFLDFDGLNFDLPLEIGPTEPDRPFWKRAMQIALDDIAGYVAPERVVLCEGGGSTVRSNFDAECYNEIFKTQYPQVVFLGAGNADDIQNDPRGVTRLLGALTPDVVVIRLIDRDDRTDAEIASLDGQGVRVLTHRTIESYLLDDSVLESVCQAFGQPELTGQFLEAKRVALRVSVEAGGPVDDIKRPAGDIYNTAKRLFPDRKLGSDKRAFMKGFCAPMIQQGTPMYIQLRQDIFGE